MPFATQGNLITGSGDSGMDIFGDHYSGDHNALLTFKRTKNRVGSQPHQTASRSCTGWRSSAQDSGHSWLCPHRSPWPSPDCLMWFREWFFPIMREVYEHFKSLENTKKKKKQENIFQPPKQPLLAYCWISFKSLTLCMGWLFETRVVITCNQVVFWCFFHIALYHTYLDTLK